MNRELKKVVSSENLINFIKFEIYFLKKEVSDLKFDELFSCDKSDIEKKRKILYQTIEYRTQFIKILEERVHIQEELNS